MSKKKIGILTGGGDCPGLNAVIRGVTKCAIIEHGMDVIGFNDGFLGLIEKRFSLLTFEGVSGILTQGGTILGSDNKANPFEYTVTECGKQVKVDVSDKCMELYNDLGLDALICVGGDGTMTIAQMMAEKGAKIVGLPKTIDKDLEGTDITFGFDSARAIATEALDRVHTTAQSHHRVLLVEIMGRNAGWLTLESGIAGGADVILIPEIPYEVKEIASVIRKRSHFGRRFSIVAVAEGAKPVGGTQTIKRMVSDSPDPVRLGGVSHVIAGELERETGIECRVAILGHVQRGGSPTPSDRLLGTRFAVKAMELVAMEQFNHMAALKGNELVAVPLEEVAGRQRLVPLDSPLIKAAISVGTSFGAKLNA
ncbi:6-phosphofructokinase [Desulforhabdus amnigena]|uniref:ATP-dependent 6-phosphofructokinase n=1 Tax=Desulforhabdus amnigena TaxID=40218 RepID=A0A9W6D4F6_9BACT|nr:ATP-dependent 6-phosphofructokinase [Desulforhabdus amnigena]NLJ27742.1 ATP-dependent 6-phosphofructokinase [Deltaproteobacteria bacterium]GLI32966.1 6-phosphofructokinase [Desulforhabdus amnigena]